MNLNLVFLCLFALLLSSACPVFTADVFAEVTDAEVERTRDARIAWWREAKFGMFIHWGLYAIPAGVWEGKDIMGVSEWIMRFAEIHVADYEPLAKQFNPTRFNAEEWVRIAKNAGMKYIVLTAKHHDGFAMYDTDVNSWNIMDASPFKRDALRELQDACKKHGIKFGIYYSHVQDWHHPDAWGNKWEFDPDKADFDNYFYNSSRPQVKELLTRYEPDMIWFDTAGDLSRARSLELVAMVRELRPNCLVNGRVGPGGGDYVQMGDNDIPATFVQGDWETPATLNDSWGYKAKDNNWKSTRELLVKLTKIVSKGGNYLLNVGPDATGAIPQPSVERLQQIGTWIDKYGEAIYGAKASPYPWEHAWGVITQKPGKLYLHIVEWPAGQLSLDGLKNKVTRAYHLGGPREKAIEFQQSYNESLDNHRLVLDLPGEAPDESISVIVVEIEGEPDTVAEHTQSVNGEIRLEAYKSKVRPEAAARRIEFTNRGAEDWYNEDVTISWDVKVMSPGTFDVTVLTSEIGGWANDKTIYWTGDHEIDFAIADQKIGCTIKKEERVENIRQPRWSFIATKAGTITIDRAGAYRAEVKPRKITDDGAGLTLNSIVLVPVE
jgi:alpha-L-fucosidase